MLSIEEISRLLTQKENSAAFESQIKQAFLNEPFSMPARAFNHDLDAYQPQVNAINAMLHGYAEPEYVEDFGDATPGSLIIDCTALAEEGYNYSTQLAFTLESILTSDSFTEDIPVIIWRTPIYCDFVASSAYIMAGQALLNAALLHKGYPAFILKKEISTQADDMSSADGYSNLLRLTTVALVAFLTGADKLKLHPFSSTPALPLHKQIKENIGQVISNEANLGQHKNLLKGSYYLMLVACKMMEAAWQIFQDGREKKNTLLEKYQAMAPSPHTTGRIKVGETHFSNPDLSIPGYTK